MINVRVTFRNLPLHSLTRFSFKDIKAASEAFKKIPGVSECVILQTKSRVEIFTVNPLETDSPDLRSAEGKGLIINKIKETWISLTKLEQFDIDHFDQIEPNPDRGVKPASALVSIAAWGVVAAVYHEPQTVRSARQ